MREIKFRAWDGAKMWTVETWEELQSENVMQYTGLKDKNGVEIYEGDIVAVLHGGWPSCSGCHPSATEHMKSLEKRYEVVFADAQFLGKRNTGSYNPWNTDDEGNTYTRLTPDKHGYVEVIGDIYSNPELLK